MNKVARGEFKEQLFGQLARITRALSSPRRIELVDLLAQAERSVEQLAEVTGMSVANTSQHLQVLRGALLVRARREGPHVYYSLADDAVFGVWQAVRELGRRQYAEIDRLLETCVSERDQLESLGARELLERMADGRVTVLDVRPEVEFRAGHIAGARSVPVQELRRRLEALPRKREIVAYCRGPLCVFADEAVSLLRKRGFRALRLEGGYPDWRAAGLPVERGGEERS